MVMCLTNVVEKKQTGSLGNFMGTIMEREKRFPSLLGPLLFFLLAIVASIWIPFYPWWMVLMIAAIIGVVSYRFPYLALIVLSVFVCAAAAYQTPEFGLFMLLFLLVLLIFSLFEWRLGYLVLLTISLSRFGLSMAVPVVSAMLLPLLLSLSVVVVSGVFLTFLVTCGNLTVAGMFVGPEHVSSFMVFYKSTLALS